MVWAASSLFPLRTQDHRTRVTDYTSAYMGRTKPPVLLWKGKIILYSHIYSWKKGSSNYKLKILSPVHWNPSGLTFISHVSYQIEGEHYTMHCIKDYSFRCGNPIPSFLCIHQCHPDQAWGSLSSSLDHHFCGNPNVFKSDLHSVCVR